MKPMTPGFFARMAVRNNPMLFRLLHARRENDHMKRRVVRPGDAALIEGFPRSANTFASYAFLLSQGEEVRFGNHFRSPAQFALARRYRVPAMLVIREPEAACVPFVNMSPCEAVKRYIAYHCPQMGIKVFFFFFFTAASGPMTSDFELCIERMSAKFGTTFVAFAHIAEKDKKGEERIAANRAKRAERFDSQSRDPLHTTISTPEKAILNVELRRQFADEALRPLLEEAKSLNKRLLED